MTTELTAQQMQWVEQVRYEWGQEAQRAGDDGDWRKLSSGILLSIAARHPQDAELCACGHEKLSHDFDDDRGACAWGADVGRAGGCTAWRPVQIVSRYEAVAAQLEAAARATTDPMCKSLLASSAAAIRGAASK